MPRKLGCDQKDTIIFLMKPTNDTIGYNYIYIYIYNYIDLIKLYIYIIHIIIYYNDIVFGIPTFRFHVNDCHFGDPGVTFVEQDPALWTALGGFVMFTGTKNLMIYSDLHGDVVEQMQDNPMENTMFLIIMSHGQYSLYGWWSSHP